MFALSSFAIAQPLYDLLGRNPTYFVAHGARAADLAAFVMGVSLLVPAGLLLLEWLVGLAGRRVRRLLHAFVMSLLAMVVAASALKSAGQGDGLPALVCGALVALGATGLYVRSAVVQRFVTYVSVAGLIFPLVFLARPGIFGLAFPGVPSLRGQASAAAHAPVVWVIFDALSLVSLVNEANEIDSARYPNFGALARMSHWFRNATTVADGTAQALPSMVTGRYVDHKKKAPVAAHFPDNVFTLLASRYDLNVVEPITRLCPHELCEDRTHGPLPARLRQLASDTLIVYAHLVLPAGLAARLPTISQGWADFAARRLPEWNQPGAWGDHVARMTRDDRAEMFRRFLETIEPAPHPRFHFFHALVPHIPYTYLPSGRRYPPRPIRGLKKELWDGDTAAVVFGQQRYLLQLQFVDRLLGELLERLRYVGMLDPALLIVASDHGVSFHPGSYRRVVEPQNRADIMLVPLFIKLPGQRDGAVSDAVVETIDIVPTIADVLGLPLPWKADGVSALRQAGSELRRRRIASWKTQETVDVDPDLPWQDAAARIRSRFGTGADVWSFYRIGPYPELVGQTVASRHPTVSPATRVQLEQPTVFEHVDTAADPSPVFVAGSVHHHAPAAGSLDVAVAVNGIIAAVTATFPQEEDAALFEAMLPEHLLHDGHNDVRVFVIEPDGGTPVLREAPAAGAHRPRRAGAAPQVAGTGVDQTAVDPDAVDGHVSLLRVEPPMGHLFGWATNRGHSGSFHHILVSADDRLIYTGRDRWSRPDIVERFSNNGLDDSGFRVSLPIAEWQRVAGSRVRVFAATKDGRVGELPIAAAAQCALRALRQEAELNPRHAAPGGVQRVSAGTLTGHIDRIETHDDCVQIHGWAADVVKKEVPRTLLVLDGERLLYEVSVNGRRPDVAAKYGMELLMSGYEVGIPLRAFRTSDLADLRVLAVSRSGTASEFRAARPAPGSPGVPTAAEVHHPDRHTAP